jgi:hypothetical protein
MPIVYTARRKRRRIGIWIKLRIFFTALYLCFTAFAGYVYIQETLIKMPFVQKCFWRGFLDTWEMGWIVK